MLVYIHKDFTNFLYTPVVVEINCSVFYSFRPVVADND